MNENTLEDLLKMVSFWINTLLLELIFYMVSDELQPNQVAQSYF